MRLHIAGILAASIGCCDAYWLPSGLASWPERSQLLQAVKVGNGDDTGGGKNWYQKVFAPKFYTTQEAEHYTINNFNLHSDFNLLNICPYQDITRDTFDVWVSEQYDISFNKILANIGDVNWSNNLATKHNVSLGAVIASPSTENPNYFYQWIRDGAITINSVINHLAYIDQFQNESLQLTVENYFYNSYNLQRLDNPSGNFNENDLISLGEPKFLVDSKPFTDSWGRPQNDGPPLRVIAIDNFLKNLEKANKTFLRPEIFSSPKDVYDKIVKLDLRFIVKNWNASCFDLWEEVNSYHFFTSLTQLKALKVGLKLYDLYDGEDADFRESLTITYKNLLKFIYDDSGFVNYEMNRIVETPSILSERSGLDAAILVGTLLTHEDNDDIIPFGASDGLILNTLAALVKSMRSIYPINSSKLNLSLGIALGRYPEDVYDGTGTSEGNPWFLTTLSASELLFKLIASLYEFEEDLVINSSNADFFYHYIIEVNLQNFDKTSGSLTVPYNSLAFNQTTFRLFNIADSFLDIVREHVADDGSMSEQINKYTGYMVGARDLTWSYGAFWNAYRWRSKAVNILGT